jgi:uncharacterized phiE125 gp8 family phage protein
MTRAIVVPAVLAGAALDELKQWLAISSPREDTMLTALLRAGLELCEAFIGLMPLEAGCEELLPAVTGWQRLRTLPVHAITGVEGIPAEGARFMLAPNDYALELDADGGARVRLDRQGAAGRIAVRFTAGMAGEWTGLPDAIRQGVLRLAVQQYSERDESSARSIPAAVAASWRPWRRVRLA